MVSQEKRGKSMVFLGREQNKTNHRLIAILSNFAVILQTNLAVRKPLKFRNFGQYYFKPTQAGSDWAHEII